MSNLEKWLKAEEHWRDTRAHLEHTLKEVPGSDLELNEFYLLYFLSQSATKELKQVELQNRLHLSLSAISRMISRLEAKGCHVIEKTQCATDKRATYITITDHGEEILASAMAVVEKELEGF